MNPAEVPSMKQPLRRTLLLSVSYSAENYLSLTGTKQRRCHKDVRSSKKANISPDVFASLSSLRKIFIKSKPPPMAATEHYYTRFEPGCFYHVYNRSVDKKPMFKNWGNYEFFLRKYDQYLSPVVDTYAYCLLGNHFHLLVRVQDLTTFEKLSNLTNPAKPQTTHDVVSHQFQKFFQSYAMAFNKQHERIGTLFQTPFKRALVDNAGYFTNLVYYIHANPKLHGLITDFRDWKWSSYNRVLNETVTRLKKNEVLKWFDNRENYVRYHAENQVMNNSEPYFIEDN